MPTLATLLTTHGISQRQLAAQLGISAAAVNQMIKHDKWPSTIDRNSLQQRISDAMAALTGLPIRLADSDNPDTDFNTATQPDTDSATTSEDDLMLLRRQNLSHTAKKAFGLMINPFTTDVQSAEDLYLTPDVRYVREALYQTARNGGFVAVCGESGAGKSTLRRDLIDRIQREKQSILVIEPYVLATEDNDQKGKTLKSLHIAEAILSTLAPTTNPKRSPEARFRQIHNLLRESSRAGNQHVLIIEEAHSLPIPTLKHLKRFFELEDGYRKLLSIVLIGQNELANKLAENNPEVREVVQRCEIVTLEPLTHNNLPDYLSHRLKATGRNLRDLIDDSGLEALADRLTCAASTRRGHTTASILYPLAVGNLLTASLNVAAELGVPVVTADVVRSV